MYEKYNIEERCRKILEDNGGEIADKARMILLEDPALKDMRIPLEFISKNWRDPLTPAIMSLSCEAVGGSSGETYEAALAMTLMHLSFYIWDDIIDKATVKAFKPTLLGKFGEGTSLIVGGLASARAFSILNRMDIDKAKHQTVTKLVWDLWATMARVETVSLRLRSQGIASCRKQFWKIKTEATDTEICLRIGAIVGNGSESEINHLGIYGRCLGIILEFWKDFHVSLNLTLELVEKIKSGALPYTLLWACEHSEKIRKILGHLAVKEKVDQSCIKQIVEDILETRALDNTIKTIHRYTKNGKEELAQLKKNNGTHSLQVLIEAQSQLFMESLSPLQAYES